VRLCGATVGLRPPVPDILRPQQAPALDLHRTQPLPGFDVRDRARQAAGQPHHDNHLR
jgi:hypothetical protein